MALVDLVDRFPDGGKLVTEALKLSAIFSNRKVTTAKEEEFLPELL